MVVAARGVRVAHGLLRSGFQALVAQSEHRRAATNARFAVVVVAVIVVVAIFLRCSVCSRASLASGCVSQLPRSGGTLSAQAADRTWFAAFGFCRAGVLSSSRNVQWRGGASFFA